MNNEDQIMKSLKCNYLECAGGGGVAGNLKCFLGGDYRDPDCNKFEKEPEDKEIEEAIEKEEIKFLSHKESNDILVEENRKLKQELIVTNKALNKAKWALKTLSLGVVDEEETFMSYAETELMEVLALSESPV